MISRCINPSVSLVQSLDSSIFNAYINTHGNNEYQHGMYTHIKKIIVESDFLYTTNYCTFNVFLRVITVLLMFLRVITVLLNVFLRVITALLMFLRVITYSYNFYVTQSVSLIYGSLRKTLKVQLLP